MTATHIATCKHELVGKSDGTAICRFCAERFSLDDRGDGPGTKLTEVLKALGAKQCEKCELRELQMNLWGRDVCNNERAAIVKMVKQEAMRALAMGRVDHMLEQWLIREGVLDGTIGDQ